MRIEHWVYTLPLRLRSLFRRNRVEQELDEELRDHIERQTAANVTSGMTPEGARRAAMAAFGGVERRKEEVRDMRGVTLIENVLMDVRYAARVLRRSPGVATVGALTLALGIGANAAIFGVVHSVLLRPRPYAHPDRLVAMFETGPRDNLMGLSKLDLQDWRAASTMFAHVAAIGYEVVTVTGDGPREQIVAVSTSPDFFATFGTAPLLGSVASAADGSVVLSEGLWKRRFGGTADIVGRTIVVDGSAHVIAGVMPAAFDVPHRAELWLPQGLAPMDPAARVLRSGLTFAELKPGVSIAAAQAEVTAIAARLAATYPNTNAGVGARLMELEESLTGKIRPTLMLLSVMAGVVLLVACTNLANLMLVRGVTRRRELAVRSALGASRPRLMRQLLMESLLLAACGAMCGLPLALWCAGALRATPAITSLPIAPSVRDGWVGGFALLLALATTVLFGTAPAWRAARADVVTGLKQAGGRGITALGTSGALVVGEVALATLLLVGAALTGRSLERLQGEALGFEPDHLMVLSTPIPGTGSARLPLETDLLRRVRALPGVASAAVTNAPPFSGGENTLAVILEGETRSNHAAFHQAAIRIVSDGFFRTAGIPVKSGRDFAPTDDSSAPVVIVNEAMVRTFWPGRNPIGARVALPLLGDTAWTAHRKGEEIWFTVIGVVGDARQVGLGIPPQPEVYGSIFFQPDVALRVAARTRVPPSTMSHALLDAAAAVNGGATARVAIMNDLTLGSVATPRVRTFIVIVFAGLALALAAIGVYGVTAHVTAQRSAEIGIRMALGARPGQVLQAVAGRVVTCAAIGLGIGLAVATATVRLIQALLYGIGPNDLAAFSGAAAVVTLIAGLAAWIPARRATRIDPTEALRAE